MNLNDLQGNVLIVGAGGHAAVIGDIFSHMKDINLIGFVDVNQNLLDKKIVGKYSIVCSESSLFEKYHPSKFKLFIGIGDNTIRARLATSYTSLGYSFVNAIHPFTCISSDVKIGTGVAVMPGAVLGARSFIDDHAIINTKASIDHDCLIGKYSHVGPAVCFGGSVKVGDLAFIGLGAVVINNIDIGCRAKVPAGFSIYKNVGDDEILSPKLGKIWKY